MSSKKGTTRKAISLKIKKEILKEFEQGNSVQSISIQRNLSYTTVSTICKRDRKKIEATVLIDQAASSTKVRPELMTKMEALLYIWIEDCNQKGLPLSTENISIKALTIFNTLKQKYDPDDKIKFAASRGWFDKFKRRHKLHSLVLNGESASANKIEADKFCDEFMNNIKGTYSLDQIFNVDETGLFWKRMPSRTFIAQESKQAPGHKTSKERLTLLLGANASGDLKLKPLLIYTSENPRAFKNVDKSKLGLYWRSNKKAWMTASLFVEWIKMCLTKELKKYSKEKNIPFNFLILIDNAPGHSNLEILNSINEGITFMFLPPNTTSLIQPMDQGCISTFKSYYLKKSYQSVLDSNHDKATVQELWKKFNIFDAVKHIVSSWADVSKNCIQGCWKKIIPLIDVEVEDDMTNVLNMIEADAVNANMLGMEYNDLLELIRDDYDFSVEELEELDQNRENDSDTETEDETTQRKELSKKNLKEIVNIFDQLKTKIKESDPDLERVSLVEIQLDKAAQFYNSQVSTQKVQKKIDSYFTQ